MTVPLRIDHVVIRVRDLDAASADYAALGFTVTPGGEHPTLGSRNALIPFEDDTYLELIAFKPRPATDEPNSSAVVRRVRGWESAAEGFADFAVVPAKIEETIAQARRHGLDILGPFPGSRRRPDGQEVSWQFGVPAAPDLPFLCADVSERHLRVPTGAARRHANGALGIERLVIQVPSLAVAKEHYQALTGVEPTGGAEAVEFLLKSSTIALIEGQGKLAHAGLVARRERGLVLLYLRVKGERTSRVLDPVLSHDAPIICV